MKIYLGKPGNMVALPAPLPEVGFSRSRGATTTTTLNGNRVVHYASAFGRRTWEYTWRQLNEDEYFLLDEFFSGQRGKGPWVLSDPSKRNVLVPQQASATDVLVTGNELAGGVGGFIVAGGETLSSTAAVTPLQGSKTLGWQLPFPTTSGIVTLASPRTGWSGYPVSPDKSAMTFSCYAQSALAVTPFITLKWYDSNGGFLSSDSSTATALTVNTWQRFSYTKTPPANAAFVQPEVKVTPGSVTSATTVYLDKIQLENGPTATTWMPGQGAPLVSILEPSETSQFFGRWEVSWTLAEVGV